MKSCVFLFVVVAHTHTQQSCHQITHLVPLHPLAAAQMLLGQRFRAMRSQACHQHLRQVMATLRQAAAYHQRS
jgi:hypothetical protein